MELSDHDIPISAMSSYGGNNGAEDAGSKRMVAAKYGECLKNHAAAMGGNATDGCGEFMPGSGVDGTPESFKCSACGCHRNFHRKEGEGDATYHYRHRHHQQFSFYGTARGAAVGPPALIMPLGAAMQAAAEPGEEGARKRYRTKFTQEQKEKMVAFAERMGWRLQRQEEGMVQQFCQEVGVRRRVLKVWMHNNKHSFAKKNAIANADAAAAVAVSAPPPLGLLAGTCSH